MNNQDIELSSSHRQSGPDVSPWPIGTLLAPSQLDLPSTIGQQGMSPNEFDPNLGMPHQILEQIGAAIGLIQIFGDHTWEYRYLSPGYESVFGYPVSEFLLSNLWMSRVDSEDRSTELADLYNRVIQGVSFTLEYRFYDRQGSLRWISTTVTPFWNQADGCWMATLLSLDISQRKQAELRLWRSPRLRQTTIDNVPDSIICKHFNLRYLGNNQSFVQGTGLACKDNFFAKTDYHLPWTPAETDWYRACDRRMMNFHWPEPPNPKTSLQAHGQHLQVQPSKIPLPDDRGKGVGACVLRRDSGAQSAPLFHPILPSLSDKPGVGILGMFGDVSDRKQAEAALYLQAAALEAVANGIMITNLHGLIHWVNPAFTNLTGYSLAEVQGKNPNQLLKSGHHNPEFYQTLWSTIVSGQVWHGEMVNRRKDGSLYTEEMTITPVRNSCQDITHFIAIKQDVSDRKAAEERLKYLNNKLEQLASLDSLTQTANRRQFDSRFEEEWQRLSREQQSLSLILLDIDYFKRYNDYFGQPQGDQCLIQIAQALKDSVLRPSDLVARYGGEEFVILLPNTHLQGAVRVVRRIRSTIQRLNLLHPSSNVSRIVTVSCGVGSLKLPTNISPSNFLACVDNTLYEAKRTRNCYCVRMETCTGVVADRFIRAK